MISRLLAIVLGGGLLAVLQSTLLGQIIPYGVVPDLALLLLISAAWRYGSMTGQIAGFLIGLTFDALGLAPLGFHALIYTVIGYLFGRLQDQVAPGPVFLPVMGTLVAMLMKYGGAFLVALVFGLNSSASRYFSLGTLWETLANIVLAPLIFIVVRLLGNLVDGRRSGFR